MNRSDAGNASLEFIGVAVILMIPLVYGIIGLSQLQSAVFGVNGAAQMAARAYANSDVDTTGRYAAWRSAYLAGRKHGLTITSDQVSVTCDTANCLMPGATVRVLIQTTARVGVPPFNGNLPLRASNVFVMEPYRQAPA